MPSCATCDRYLSPATVRPDGRCPTCGRPVDVAAAASPETSASEERTPVPWHLKVAIAALALYLGWRAYEGVLWLIARLG